MAEDAETFACEYCDREFDSKRGLHIHQSQVHPDEEKQETGEKEESGTEQADTESEDDSSDIFPEEETLELEETEEEFSVKAGKGDTVNMSLTTRQVAAAALIVGLLIGGIIAGIYFSTAPAM